MTGAATEIGALPRGRDRMDAVGVWHGARTDWIGYVFIAFFAIPFVLFNIMPILFGIYVGFTDWSIIGTPNWVGIANFERAFR